MGPPSTPQPVTNSVLWTLPRFQDNGSRQTDPSPPVASKSLRKMPFCLDSEAEVHCTQSRSRRGGLYRALPGACPPRAVKVP